MTRDELVLQCQSRDRDGTENDDERTAECLASARSDTRETAEAEPPLL